MASQGNQPAWMAEGQAEEYAPPPPAPGGYAPPQSFSAAPGASESFDKKFYVKMAIKVVLIGMSVMMLANGKRVSIEHLSSSSNCGVQ